MSRRRSVPPIEELAAALYEHAAGSLADTAAVNLVIAHEVWLRRRDFQEQFLRARYCHPTCTPAVAIRWRAAITALGQGQLPCSGSGPTCCASPPPSAPICRSGYAQRWATSTTATSC